jgi:hypothetical protein
MFSYFGANETRKAVHVLSTKKIIQRNLKRLFYAPVFWINELPHEINKLNNETIRYHTGIAIFIPTEWA